MGPRDVRDMVRAGRAVKAPNYHPGKRGISFGDILVALERCYHVAPDDRGGHDGRPLHRRGWFAIANLPARRRPRIDFDLHTDDEGHIMLIVTAYHL